jgi:FkbM family methyltransferase
MSIVDRVKSRLLQAGPESSALRLAFRLQAAMHGTWMRSSGNKISLRRKQREIILGPRDMILIPFAVHMWDTHFDTLEGELRNGRTVLDFSQPALHRYRKSGLSFHFPSFAEEDAMDAYTAAYHPQPGDVVWDVGANAGTTTYFFAQMVGPTGKVYAFEPDETNYAFLMQNLELHQVTNVVPVKAALSGTTGTAMFCMDGTMCAGLSDSLAITASKLNVEVETITLQDACDRFGSVPNYVKMDIEGAEVDVIKGAQSFLRDHSIHFAIESNHMVDGQLTDGPLEKLLGGVGYHAWSSEEFGQLFTWAEPPR